MFENGKVTHTVAVAIPEGVQEGAYRLGLCKYWHVQYEWTNHTYANLVNCRI